MMKVISMTKTPETTYLSRLKWGTVESNTLLDVPIVIPEYADGKGH